MQQIIALITQAIAFISGLKGTNTALVAENADLRKQLGDNATLVEGLKKQVADDEVDDTALEKAATDARAAEVAANEKAEARQAELDAIKAEGDKLAAAITENPNTPNVDPEFKVVG